MKFSFWSEAGVHPIECFSEKKYYFYYSDVLYLYDVVNIHDDFHQYSFNYLGYFVPF
jgi:hypothetical protein